MLSPGHLRVHTFCADVGSSQLRHLYHSAFELFIVDLPDAMRYFDFVPHFGGQLCQEKQQRQYTDSVVACVHAEPGGECTMCNSW